MKEFEDRADKVYIYASCEVTNIGASNINTK
ncbi:Uncharacterized protein BCZB5J_03914 [Bacillus cereus]|nr:Uncharacterized protein BCZB5J_03914 [Bacillus cereus]